MIKQWDKSILLWIVVLIIITSIPVYLGFTNQNIDWRFSGLVMSIDDGNSYIAKMMQGYQGAWLYKAPYSLEAQTGLLVFLPYILLGKLASPPALHTQLVILFHLFRIAGIIVMVLGINRFLLLFPLRQGYRLLVLILSTAGGGTGWIILLFGKNSISGWVPLEFISPEGFGFLSAYTIPHLAFARGLLFGSVAFFLEGISFWQIHGNKINISWIFCGTGLFLIGIFQPLYCAIAVLWMGIIVLITLLKSEIRQMLKWKDILPLLWVCLPSALWIGYVLIMGRIDPYMQEWNKQNIVLSPPIGVYLLSYGVFYLYLIVNFRKMRVAISTTQEIFVFILLVLIPVLIYIPFNLQRRLSEGLWLSFLILIALFIQNTKKPIRQVIKTALIMLSIPSTIILIIMGIQTGKKPSTPVFVSADNINVYQKAGEIGGTGNFLTSFRVGNEITAWAPVRVSLGQGPETIFYKKFESMYDSYVNGMTDLTTRLTWMDLYNIRYAIIDQSKINNLNDVKTYGKEVYSSGNLKIMELIR